MNLYGLFILDVNIKYMVFSILYRHINVPMAYKELINSEAVNGSTNQNMRSDSKLSFVGKICG